MSVISPVMATVHDTRTPAEIARDKAWAGRFLDQEADSLLDELQSYLEDDMQVSLNHLAKSAQKLKPDLRKPDSKHYQRVQQVLRQVHFVQSAMTDVVRTHQTIMEAHAAWDTSKFPPATVLRGKAPRKALAVSSTKSKKQKN